MKCHLYRSTVQCNLTEIFFFIISNLAIMCIKTIIIKKKLFRQLYNLLQQYFNMSCLQTRRVFAGHKFREVVFIAKKSKGDLGECAHTEHDVYSIQTGPSQKVSWQQHCAREAVSMAMWAAVHKWADEREESAWGPQRRWWGAGASHRTAHLFNATAH